MGPRTTGRWTLLGRLTRVRAQRQLRQHHFSNIQVHVVKHRHSHPPLQAETVRSAGNRQFCKHGSGLGPRTCILLLHLGSRDPHFTSSCCLLHPGLASDALPKELLSSEKHIYTSQQLSLISLTILYLPPSLMPPRPSTTTFPSIAHLHP